LTDDWSIWNAGASEALGTFFLCFIILLYTDKKTTLIDEDDDKKNTILTIF